MHQTKEKRPLTPGKVFEVQGNLSYSESLGAWNTLRFRKELMKEFPQLKEKRSKFSYKLVSCRDLDEFKKTIEELKKEKIKPLLLFLYKERDL